MGYDPTSHKTVYMGCVWGCRNIPQKGRGMNEGESERMKKE